MDAPGASSRSYNQWDNHPELEAVRVFAAVAEARSFRRAAAALRLPRSTVSRRLARLEASLKARLLQRTTRHVSLTDAGEAFLKRVSPALHMIRDAGRGVMDATAEPRGALRVTATSASAASVGAVLLRLVERYPQVILDLEFTDRKVDLVAEGFDIAVRPGALGDSSLIARPLGRGQPGYYASPAYLQRRRRPRTPRDLTDHACLVFTGSSRVARWKFRAGRKTREIAVRGPLRANSLEVVRLAAVRGHGVAWLPETLARDDVAAGRLLPVLRDHWPAPVPVHLVYPSSRHLAPQVRAAIDALTEALGDGLP
ncbi:MAG TPA: LysR substrate-binding domain-containing protein [Polyangia bacterium]